MRKTLPFEHNKLLLTTILLLDTLVQLVAVHITALIGIHVVNAFLEKVKELDSET